LQSVPTATASEEAQGRNNVRAIDEIIVGERHRRDLGDIEGLAASIAEVGLLQPIAVTFDGYLIAGERRLRAVQLLGWRTIPCTLIPLNLNQIVRGEFAENTCRKDFTLSEAVAIKRALEPLEKAAAKGRQAASGGKGRIASGKLPTAITGRAADKAAKATGMARRTLEKAEAVVDAAEAEPEKFGKLLADMDRTGRVNGVYRRLKNTQQAARIRAEPPPLPDKGPYRAAMADPAWAYEPDDENAPERGVLPYRTMSIEHLCAVDVASIMHQDSVICLWVTNFVLARGLHIPVLSAWGGFEPKTIITWPKDRPGRGRWAFGQTEHLVLAVRGQAVVTLSDRTTTLLRGPFHLVRKNAHSEKPIESYAFVESLCPAPRYADLFSRYRYNDKWDCHGDQAPAAVDERPELWDEMWARPFDYSALDQQTPDHGVHDPRTRKGGDPAPAAGEMPDIPDFLRRMPPGARP
jgi:N6-adenosine-specific RNA methylase IME4/ParB-like chromosome segregation protein Spo0J